MVAANTIKPDDAPHQHRVLIVEGEASLRQQASEAFEGEEFHCEFAENGPQAMPLLEAETYDVVLVDLRLSLGPGRSFCIELLQRFDPPLTVVVTDKVQPHIVEALKSRGAADVCVKPIDFTALVPKIKDLLAARDLQKKAAASAVSESSPPEVSETAGPSDEPASTTGNAAEKTDLSAAHAQGKRIVMTLLKDAKQSDELSEMLTAAGVHAIAVPGSEDLYQRLNQQRVDLVIIENDLGGFLTGLEILKRLHDNLIRPETILLADPNERINQQAQSVGVKNVVDLNRGLDKIIEAINGRCVDISDRSEIIPLAARRLVQEFEGIPPLPQLVVKLVGYMGMPVEDIPIKELAKDISYDPKAIADILKMTNSASMGLSRKVTKINEALTLLGPKRVISLILASATVSAQKQLLKRWPEPLRKWYHKRSVLVASTAATFAENLENISADTAFALGLLQDIGVLVLANRYQDEYTAILKRFREVGQLQLHGLEEREFRVSHPAISAALLQKWSFPQSLVGPILDHHNMDSDVERSPLENSLMHAMRIGEALANLSDLAHPARRQMLNALLAKYDASMAERIKTCLQEAVTRTSESCKLFSLPAPDQAAMDELLATATANEDAENDAAATQPVAESAAT